MKKQSKVHYIFSQILASFLFLPGRYFSIFTILLLSVSVLAPSNSYSQKGSMEVSVFAGPNYFNTRGFDPPAPTGRKAPASSFGIGLGYSVDLNEYLALKANIILENKRIKREFSTHASASEQYAETHQYNYLTFPIMLNAHIGNRLQGFINGGFFFSYLYNPILIEYETDYGHSSVDGSKYDMGPTIGLGGRYCINDNFLIETEFRYSYGLAAIENYYEYRGHTDRLSTKTYCLTIGCAYKFNNKSS